MKITIEISYENFGRLPEGLIKALRKAVEDIIYAFVSGAKITVRYVQ